MSPAPKKKKPADPKEGKVAETTPEEATEAKQAVDAEAAAEAAEAPAPKPKRTRRKAAEPKAADQAAAETGVDKRAAAATGPSRRHRQKTDPSVLVHARARYVRTSARKARLVCDHIRGKDVAEARAILAFTPRGAAEPWLKLLESAVANAEHNHELVGEDLRIAAVRADEGPTLKRFRPRAMGRATRIRKRTSHLTITLTPKES
jgi:ribosomal protein L22